MICRFNACSSALLIAFAVGSTERYALRTTPCTKMRDIMRDPRDAQEAAAMAQAEAAEESEAEAARADRELHCAHKRGTRQLAPEREHSTETTVAARVSHRTKAALYELAERRGTSGSRLLAHLIRQELEADSSAQ